MGEVLDDYFGNQSKLKDAILFPGENATQEEIDAFLKRMDIPKTPADYKLDSKLIPGPETNENKETAAKGLADFFKTLGLTKGQAAKMYEQYISIVKGVNEAGATRQKALADSFEERLLKDSGNDKTATETKEYFKRALIALGDKQLVQELKESSMLYSTSFVRGLADIWKAGNKEPPIPQAGPGREAATKDALPKSDQFKQQYGGK